MPTVKITEVEVTEVGFNILVEYDFTLVQGALLETLHIFVSKPEYLFWKETNPTGTVLDYIKSLVKPHYEKLLTMKTLATQLNLVNQTLTW